MGLLGFNAVRVQFTFANLNRELPAGAEPEFYPCLVSAVQQRCNSAARAAAFMQTLPADHLSLDSACRALYPPHLKIGATPSPSKP
jgi:hypothetical protein